MTRALLGVGLLASCLTACAVGPKYTAPRITMPEAWNEAPMESTPAADPSTLEQWWTIFHDSLLDDLVARAREGNLDLKIAAVRVREARAARGIAASAALPQVDAHGQYLRGQRSDAVPPFQSATGGPSPFGPRTQNVLEAGFDASWEIDVFGGVRRDVEAAVAQIQTAEEARRDVLVVLLGDVARDYAELRGLQRRLDILDQTMVSLADTRDIAKARFDAGLGTALDIERAQGFVDTTTSRRPELEQAMKQTIHRLGVLVGQQPTALAPLLEPSRAMPAFRPDVPTVLPSELLSRRPDLRRAEREVAAATARIGVARADLFPRFSITGNFGRRSDDASDLASEASQFWFVVPVVRWPMLSGGRLRANLRVHEARQEETVLRYEKAVLTAISEVEDALVAHNREQRRLDHLRAAVAANRRALDLATERYTSGLENFLSVLDAQRVLYAAEDSVAESETATMTALIALYKALGGGWTLDATTAEETSGLQQ